MFFSGVPEIRRKRAIGSLGDFNPMPMPITLGNTFGWTAYSLLTRNVFVAIANVPGLVLSVWYVMSALQLAELPVAQRLEKLTLAISGVHVLAAVSCAFVLKSHAAMVTLYGLLCNAILLAYYGAPLSTIGKVWKTRSALSIYFPTVLVNGLNAVFWTTYAIAIRDAFILVPNALGACLAAVQCGLCLMFRGNDQRLKALESEETMALAKSLVAKKEEEEEELQEGLHA